MRRLYCAQYTRIKRLFYICYWCWHTKIIVQHTHNQWRSANYRKISLGRTKILRCPFHKLRIIIWPWRCIVAIRSTSIFSTFLAIFQYARTGNWICCKACIRDGFLDSINPTSNLYVLRVRVRELTPLIQILLLASVLFGMRNVVMYPARFSNRIEIFYRYRMLCIRILKTSATSLYCCIRM